LKVRTRLLAWYSGVFFFAASMLVGTMHAVITHKLLTDFLCYLTTEYNEVRRATVARLNDAAGLPEAIRLEVSGSKYFPMSFRLWDMREKKPSWSMPAWPAGTPCCCAAWWAT